ncbi:MAG: hypothetical protein ACOYBJ_00005 [Patescibacteria group bacterium]|jgi:hypothetical protein
MSTLTVVAEATTPTPLRLRRAMTRPRHKHHSRQIDNYQLDLPMCAICGNQHQIAHRMTAHPPAAQLAAFIQGKLAGDDDFLVGVHLWVERCLCCWYVIGSFPNDVLGESVSEEDLYRR